MPPAEAGALRDDWQRLAGIVESYREAAGITDPEQAIGPVPSGKAHLAEAFHASVRALRLPDEAALLKAMNQGQLEAQVQEYVRAEAVAPPDVQAEVGDLEHSLEEARARRRQPQPPGTWRRRKPRRPRRRARPGPGTAGRRRRSPPGMARGHGRAGNRGPRGNGRAPRRGTPETEAVFRDRLHRMVTGTEATQEARAEAEAEAQAAPEAESEAEFLERLPQVPAEAEARQAAQADAAAEPQAEPGDVDPELVRQAGEDLDAEPCALNSSTTWRRSGPEPSRVGELVDAMPDRQAEQRAQREQEIRGRAGDTSRAGG